jgi:hypothetical protein
MKVLVATKKCQGMRLNDFSYTTDGELVRYGFDCDGETIDGSCGCLRSLIGFDSLKGTTTFRIAEQDLSMQKITGLIRQSLIKSGYISKTLTKDDKDILSITVKETLNLWKLFDPYPIGAVLERRGDSFSSRIPETGLCPICGEKIKLIGKTVDGRPIGSCQDAFTFKQWLAD